VEAELELPEIVWIIPSRNEQSTIRDLLEKIPPNYKVILADTSEDQTPEIARLCGRYAKLVDFG
jgi:hypothetical protein